MEVSKLVISNQSYSIKDSTARNSISNIVNGTTVLDSVNTSGNININGDLVVGGNITQQGSSYETHAEQVYTKKDLIKTREGATSGLLPGEYTGIEAVNYNGTRVNGQLVFDSNGTALVGDVNDLEPLATREENPMPNGSAYWNSNSKSFLTAIPTFNIIANGSVNVAKTGTVGALTEYINGMSIKVLFPNGHYGDSFSFSIDSLEAKNIFINKDGIVSLMSSNSIDRGDGLNTQNWYVQPFVTLEMMYLDTLDNGLGGWLVMNNPIVLSSQIVGYTIYANGSVGNVDLIYPVGSLYWSSKPTNPQVWMIGTVWTQIKDRFIWAKGDSDTINATGGEKTHTLTVAEMPSHDHGGSTGNKSLTTNGAGGHKHEITVNLNGTPDGQSDHDASSDARYWNGARNSQGTYLNDYSATGNAANTLEVGNHTHTISNHSHSIKAQGSGYSHNNMPPFIVKYCWERIS